MASYVKKFGLIGIAIGGLLFLLFLIGLEIPVVIGNTTYKGIQGGLILWIGTPILLIIIGLVASIFTSRK